MAERNCRKCFHSKACKEVASHSGYSDISYTESQCKHFTPTTDVVEVKRGNWIIKKFKDGMKYIICSVCDSVIDSSYTSINENEFDYCPYCGAKIEERNLA